MATDIFPANAKKTFEIKSIDIPIETLNINAIEKNESSIPNCCMYQVMEHIESPLTALRELYRTLSPGGKLIIVGQKP